MTITNDDEKSVFNKKSLLEKWNIPITHLDFQYINNCLDVKEVEKILRILKNGEEGYYPQLLEVTEKRLKILKPDSKLLIQQQPVLNEKSVEKEVWNDLNEDIDKWIHEINQLNFDLEKNKKLPTPNLPKVREPKQSQMKSKPVRISSTNYEAWDKYDPDLELLKEEIEEKQRKNKNRKNKTVFFESFENLTQSEARLLASKERNYGNEFYKAKDYLEAKVHYTNSIKLYPTVEAFNNRCITNIKLKKFSAAIKDCEQVLTREPNNIKALFRKAIIFEEFKNFTQAIGTLQKLILTDPNNEEAQIMMNRIKKKMSNTDSSLTKVRLNIKEDSSSDEQNSETFISINDKQLLPLNQIKTSNKLKKSIKKIEIPIPSTSKYTGPGVKIVEVTDLENDIKIEPVTKNNGNLINNSPKIIEIVDSDDCIPLQEVNDLESNQLLLKKTKMVESKDQNNKIDQKLSVVKVVVNTSENDIKDQIIVNDGKIPKELGTNQINNLKQSNIDLENSNDILKKCNFDENLKFEKINNDLNKFTTNFKNNNQNLKTDNISRGDSNAQVDLITNGFMFMNAWRRCQNNLEMKVEILKILDIEKIDKILKTNFDVDLFVEFLECLSILTLHKEYEIVYQILAGLTKLPRFEIIVMLMNDLEKTMAKSLCEILIKNNYNNENLVNIFKLFV